MYKTKICIKCKVELDINLFGKLKRNKDGLDSYCKSCNNEKSKKSYENNSEKKLISCKKYREENSEKISEYHKKYYQENSEEILERNKKWAKENPEKEKERHIKWREANFEKVAEYYENNKSYLLEYAKKYNKQWYKENRINRLKECKIYRTNNKEMISARYKIYYKINKEMIANRSKIYRDNNKNKILIYSNKYYDNNKEKIAIKSKNYAKNNRDKCNILHQKRRAREHLLLTNFTIEQWESAKQYFKNKCCYCGEVKPLEQEHFISVANKGGYVKENIICACKSCNCSKSDNDFFSWYPNFEFYNKDREENILEYLNLIKTNN